MSCCPRAGRCHWETRVCRQCGDVSTTCDKARCEQHRCAACNCMLTSHEHDLSPEDRCWPEWCIGCRLQADIEALEREMLWRYECGNEPQAQVIAEKIERLMGREQ